MPRLPSMHINAGRVYINAVALLASAKGALLQTNALASIVFAALSLETFINELAYIANGIFRGTEGDWLLTFGDIQEELELSHAPITAKYLMGKFTLSGMPFDKGKNPYQDFALLVKLRNEIAHQKPFPGKFPQPGKATNTKRPVLEQLRSFGVLREFPTSPEVELVGTNWLDEISTRETAVWACNVAATMVICMLDAVPKSEFRNALDLFYRKAFRQVRKSVAADLKH